MTAPTQRLAAGLSYIACDGSAGTAGGHAARDRQQCAVLRAAHAGARWFASHACMGCAGLWRVAAACRLDWPDAGDYAAALDRLLAHLEVSRCILVGHSLGTLIAARFALISPRRVAALVLISPALGYGTDKGAALPPAVADRLDELDRLGRRKLRCRASAAPACRSARASRRLAGGRARHGRYSPSRL